jgi:hypothetical protein
MSMKHRGRFRAAVVCTVAFGLSACARAPSPAIAAPAVSTMVVVDRLFFGRNIPSGGMVSDSAWSMFLTEVVTPRFPDGFTVTRSEGQWRGADRVIVREPGFVFEVGHPPGVPHDSVFEAIAAEYRRRFRQEAVLRVRAAAEQWLYSAPPR